MKDEKTVTNEQPGGVTTRKLIGLNGSLYICLPRKFVISHNLQAGDRVPVIVSSGHVKIVPYEKVPNPFSTG